MTAPRRFGDEVNARWMHSVSAWLGFRNLGPLTRGRIVVGVDNLFDKNPPFLGGDGTCKCNTLAGPYDFAGRTFFAKLSVDFVPPPPRRLRRLRRLLPLRRS